MTVTRHHTTITLHTCLQDPVQRIIALSENCIIERDPATYQIATLRPLCDVRRGGGGGGREGREGGGERGGREGG